MLVLRSYQLKELGALRQNTLKTRYIDHLKKHFSEECRLLDTSEGKLAEFVNYCYDKSKKLNIESEVDICRYLSLSILYGADFDTSLWWAKDLVEEGAKQSSTPLIDLMFHQGLKRIDDAKGPQFN